MKVNLRPLIYELKVLTKERGIVRFGDIINASQEALISEVERQIERRGNVRIVVLKARQMGISTVIEAIIFALSIMYSDFQSLIISHESESAEHILGMTKRYWNTYTFRKFHDEQYAARKQLSWSDLGSNIVVATAKNTDAGRSKTLHALHASEVAMWDDPETMVNGLRQAIPDYGLTAIFYESTAKGIGNFFHQTWLDAINEQTEFKAMFFPWWQFPEYTAHYMVTEDVAKYASPPQDPVEQEAEATLRSWGVSEERLIWRRWAIQNKTQGSLDKFKEEYPATWMEAFLSTGRNVFRLPSLERHYIPMKPDIGKLERNNRGDVVFIKDERGPLKIYRYPAKDKNWGVYQIGADPTHTVTGDNACAQVINRRTMEQSAVYSAKVDPVKMAAEIFLLGEFYNEAMLVPERTGPGYGTVAWLLAQGYRNLYESLPLVKTPGLIQDDTWGWTNNVQMKQLAIGRTNEMLEQQLGVMGKQVYGLQIHDEATFKEMRDYIINDKGEYTNGNGSKHDDTVMALAIAVVTHLALPLHPYVKDDTEHRNAEAISDRLPQDLKLAPQSNGSTPSTPGTMTMIPVPSPIQTEENVPDWQTWEDQ